MAGPKSVHPQPSARSILIEMRIREVVMAGASATELFQAFTGHPRAAFYLAMAFIVLFATTRFGLHVALMSPLGGLLILTHWFATQGFYWSLNMVEDSLIDADLLKCWAEAIAVANSWQKEEPSLKESA